MKRRARVLTILFSAILTALMMSAMAFAMDKEEELKKAEKHAVETKGFSVLENDVHLWVGGQPVEDGFSGEIQNACTGGTASVVFNDDNSEATLTLTNARISGNISAENDVHYNILSKGINLTIVLEGKNTIAGKDTLADYAICTRNNEVEGAGNLTITGSGELEIEGSEEAIYSGGICRVESGKVTTRSTNEEAICAIRKVEIIDGEVSATSVNNDGISVYEGDCVISGGKVTAVSSAADEDHDAIYASNKVEISGGEVSATSSGDDGIYTNNDDCVISGGKVTATGADDGIYSRSGNIVISGGKVTATAEQGAGIATYYDVMISAGEVSATAEKLYGIYGDDNVTISGGKISAKVEQAISEAAAINAGEKDITISGDDTVVTAEIVGDSESGPVDEMSALFADDNVTISEGKVSANVSNGRRYCDAIYANKDIEISDAKVTAETDSGHAINADSVDITYTEEAGKRSTYVEAKVEASNSSAIAADKNSLTKSDNLAITTPKGGEIGNYRGEYSTYATIMDGDKYASHAVIQPASYKIAVADTTGGKAKVEPESAGQGEEVKVVTTPDEGYEVDKIIIVDEDGKETDVTGKSAFTMGNSDVTVKVTFKKKAALPVIAARGTARGKRSLRVTWNKVAGAAKYEVWMSKCNTPKKKRALKKVKTLSADKTTFTKKNLKKNAAYKFRVIAKDASGNVISKSLTGHVYTGNVRGGHTNAKSLKLARKAFTLNKGGTARIKATQTKARRGKKLCNHAKLLRYTSNNPYVAKVDSSGKITAVGEGTCKVYVQTANGIWKICNVTVK